MSAQSEIAELYVGYFNRAPDPAGLGYWVGRFNQGMVIEDIARSFSQQVESTSQYSFLANPNGGDKAAFINQVYNNLFGRDVEPAGLQYWLNDLNNGMPPGLMVVAMIHGALGNDAIAVQNQVSVGLYYSTELVEHSKAWSLASAKSVIDEVDQTAPTVLDGYYEVDQYILNGAINPPNLTPGTPVDPNWPVTPVEPPVVPPVTPPVTPPIIPPVITDPLTGLPAPVGPLLSDVIGTVNDVLQDATTLNVGGLLGNLLGNVLNLVTGLTDDVANIVGFTHGLTHINLTGFHLPVGTQIDNLGNITGLRIDQIFTDEAIARVTIGGQSLILVDVNQNHVFDIGQDLQLLGLGNATIADFVL